MELKILATSDLHGNMPYITTPFDLLLICGDICPAHDHYFNYQIGWFQHEFSKWINTLPFKDENSKVVFIAGNHDFFGERIQKEHLDVFNVETQNRCVYLKNTGYNYEYISDNGLETLSIFGTPYCKIFGSWAFMVSDKTLEKKYKQIPDNVDILISHDSPTLNELGFIHSGWNAGTEAGNKVLDKYIVEKKPKYFFSGHIHSGNHAFKKIEDTYMANVSYINENYTPFYPILEFTLNGETKELVV